ncbi:hypothetical protein K2Z84_03600 [Candidatus Binatia bacterium]|jgi:hypothetical protein|nr:hypothetical protein [Candidatus Binatia bacterium]
MSTISLDEARSLFGDDLLDADAVRVLLGAYAEKTPEIPFSREIATAAKADGCLLVLRPQSLPGVGPVTLAGLRELCAKRDGLVAFAGEDPWFVDDEAVNAVTAEPGWALVAKEPWRETLNLVYDRAEDALRRRAGELPWRRRRAAEIAFDTLAYLAARGKRLLGERWDWSSTHSHDGALVNVGGFGDKGLDVLSYSKAVKHGALGICPTLVEPVRR